MKKNKPSVPEQLVSLLQTSTDLFADILHLAILEAKLSAKNILSICSLLILLLVITLTTWICFLAAIAFYLISLGFKPEYIFILIGLINLLPIIPIILMFRFYLQQIGMNATIRQLTYKTEKTE